MGADRTAGPGRKDPCRGYAGSIAARRASGAFVGAADSATSTKRGTRIEDSELLERIKTLAIPPAWTDVWICPDSRGHIQATGQDDAGRKEYLYHDAWREHRDREKFEQMLSFGRALPPVRRRLEEDVRCRGLVRERVLACAIRLLDLGFFRIGSERYAEENETHGLATLKRRHVSLERGKAVFDYRAKGSQRHVQVVADPLILPTIRALKARGSAPGGLLAFRNGRGWPDLGNQTTSTSALGS